MNTNIDQVANKTIYVVTSGSYSDYSIHGIYEDEEIAKKCVAQENKHVRFSFDKYSIEEWPLNAQVDKIKAGLSVFHVAMDKAGDSNINYRNFWWEKRLELLLIKRHEPQSNKSTLFGHVWAKDEQHAAKIANEKRTWLIASGEWPAVEFSWEGTE